MKVTKMLVCVSDTFLQDRGSAEPSVSTITATSTFIKPPGIFTARGEPLFPQPTQQSQAARGTASRREKEQVLSNFFGVCLGGRHPLALISSVLGKSVRLITLLLTQFSLDAVLFIS